VTPLGLTLDLALAAAGWAGAAALLVAYAMASANRLPPGGAAFQTLNLLGAAGLAANSGYHAAWPSAALNLVWMAVGLAALARRSGSRR
jgi:hypothetical protein